MICDWDDLYEGHDGMSYLSRLRDANPAFKATVFAVAGRCSDEFLDGLPGWLEVAAHGWMHNDSYECARWTAGQMHEYIDDIEAFPRFVHGFKAPGWQISDGCYQALVERGWWCADHPENNLRRPIDLRVHVYGTGDHWHGHIQNVCGNGLAETWPVLLERVKAADSFQFISEVVAAAAVPA